MALLAEELVEEWLNRSGYFTIRGIKLGVHEIDLLAVKQFHSGPECRHVEVQASVRPVSYLIPLPRAVVKATGRTPHSSGVRTDDELKQGAEEWVQKKFYHPKKVALRRTLCDFEWSLELVVHKLRYEREMEFLEATGIKIHRLDDVIIDLRSGRLPIEGASGANLVDLIGMASPDSTDA